MKLKLGKKMKLKLGKKMKLKLGKKWKKSSGMEGNEEKKKNEEKKEKERKWNRMKGKERRGKERSKSGDETEWKESRGDKILLSYDLSLLHSIVTKLIIRINNEILHDKFPSNVKSVSGALPGLFISVNLNIKTSAFHLFETMIKKSQNIIQSRKNNFHRNLLSGDNNEIIDNKLEESSLDYSLSINDLSTYTMISKNLKYVLDFLRKYSTFRY